MQNNEYVVEMRGIDKIYPNGIAANQGVDFLVKKGEIHALMGENGAGIWICMAMAAGAFLVMILLPYLFFRKGSRDREVGLLLAAFPNVGFYGIPLISGIYGDEGVFFLTTMITMFNLLLWTYGVLLMSGKRDTLKNTVKRLISPSLIAIPVGLLCFS